MKYDITGPSVESSGVEVEGEFGIDLEDMGPILHILRSKLYSNIIRAVVQEYLCNGRDAQRVKGNTDVPIRVTLPTAFEMSWKCRDYGTGIAPENMKRVFIRFGRSTKRGDNLQTGGFGIGCKTGFGYGDAFHVTTYLDGVARSYACILDETKKGQLLLLGEKPTTEPNGTEIIVPVKREDVARFREETVRATEFWDVRPVIVGGGLTWEDVESKATLRGSDWFICNAGRYHRPSCIVLLVDGIEYPFPMDQLRTHLPFSLHNGSRVFLRFGVGQVPVAANREQVEVDDKTRLLVSARLEKVGKELLATFKAQVDAAPSYIAACMTLRKGCNDLGMEFPTDQTWNGMKLHGPRRGYRSNLEIPGSVAVYNRGASNVARKDRHSGFVVEEDVVYVSTTQDFNSIVENGATAIFKANPTAKKVLVVRWTNPVDADTEYKGFGFRDLSEFYTPKNRKAALNRLTFFKFNDVTRTFSRTSYAEFEADQNQKVWCRLVKVDKANSWAPYPNNGLVMKFDDKVAWNNNEGVPGLLKFVGDDAGISLYGFAVTLPEDRVQEATEGLGSLDGLVLAKVAEEGIDPGEVVYANDHRFQDHYLFMGGVEEAALAHRENFSSASVYGRYLRSSYLLHAKIARLTSLSMLAALYEKGGVKACSFGAATLNDRREVLAQYPMLNYVVGGHANIAQVEEYVLLLDSSKGTC